MAKSKLKWERNTTNDVALPTYEAKGFRIYRRIACPKRFWLKISDCYISELRLKTAKAMAQCLADNFPKLFKK